MKYLIIIAHVSPNGKSTAHRLAAAAEAALKSGNNEIKTVDLSRDGFGECASPKDFVNFDESKDYIGNNTNEENRIKIIRDNQENLKWCDQVLIFGPMWFFRYPACLYAYIDRVISGTFKQPSIMGKKVLFVITAAADNNYYSHQTGLTSIDALLYSTTFQMHYSGFKVYRSLLVTNCPKNSDETNEKLKKVILDLEHRPFLDFEQKSDGKDNIEVFASLPNLSIE